MPLETNSNPFNGKDMPDMLQFLILASILICQKESDTKQSMIY